MNTALPIVQVQSAMHEHGQISTPCLAQRQESMIIEFHLFYGTNKYKYNYKGIG